MVTITSTTLRAIWAETRGSPDSRARQLMMIAPARGVPATELGPIRDLIARKQFGNIAALFGESTSSTRPHDVKTGGMRTGGFGSVHPTAIAAKLPPKRDPVERPSPTILAKQPLYRFPGWLTEAQRDWVADGSGEVRPEPAPCGSANAFGYFAVNLDRVCSFVVTGRRRPQLTIPEHERLFACTKDSLASPDTQAMLDRVCTSGTLAEKLTVERGVRRLHLLTRMFGEDVPELRTLPLASWSSTLARADIEGHLLQHMRSALTDGRLADASALQLSIERRRGGSHETSRTLAAAALIESGSFHAAASRLAFATEGTPLGDLWERLRSSPVVITAHDLAALHRDGHALLVACLRRRGTAQADGSLTLTSPPPLTADGLIAAGRALLTPGALDAIARCQGARNRFHADPSSINKSTLHAAEDEVVEHMSALKARVQGGHGDRDRYDVLADGVEITLAAQFDNDQVEQALMEALHWTGGRGIALVTKIDAVRDVPHAETGSATLNLMSHDFARDTERELDVVRDTFHELGHAVENADPALYAAAAELRERRAAGRTPITLTTTTGTIEALPGDYLDRYMGRVYPGRQATEIFTGGFEHFGNLRHMTRLATGDLELFSFVLGYLVRPRHTVSH